MTSLRTVVIASFVISTTLSFAANLPRNPNVVVCEPNAGCIHHTIFGHDYKILSTDRFTVMVFLSSEGRYTRADVSITNLTPDPIKPFVRNLAYRKAGSVKMSAHERAFLIYYYEEDIIKLAKILKRDLSAWLR